MKPTLCCMALLCLYLQSCCTYLCTLQLCYLNLLCLVSQYLVPFAGAKIIQSRWCKDIPSLRHNNQTPRWNQSSSYPQQYHGSSASEASFIHCPIVGSTSLCAGGWFRSDVTTKRQLVHCVQCCCITAFDGMSCCCTTAHNRDKYDINIACFGAVMGGGGYDDNWLHLGLVVEPQVGGDIFAPS